MPSAQQSSSLAGSFRIFSVVGISVYVHWSWLLVAGLALQARYDAYDSQAWNVAEYLSLFGIVLLHEFGHAFAGRQVGGRADEIVLWPLGGYTVVQPPARPGPVLWTFAGGPLVNVVLVPVTIGIFLYGQSQGLDGQDRGAGQFLFMLALINAALLVFNMLPIYPLDGGQILHALLWFAIGRAKSLAVVCVIGLIGAAAFILLALLKMDLWIGIVAAFAAYRCWTGLQQARILAQLERAPRHPDAACPSCDAHPLEGPFWQCDRCHANFDTFVHHAECPGCGRQFPMTACPECQQTHPIWAWFDAEAPPSWRER